MVPWTGCSTTRRLRLTRRQARSHLLTLESTPLFRRQGKTTPSGLPSRQPKRCQLRPVNQQQSLTKHKRTRPVQNLQPWLRRLPSARFSQASMLGPALEVNHSPLARLLHLRRRLQLLPRRLQPSSQSKVRAKRAKVMSSKLEILLMKTKILKLAKARLKSFRRLPRRRQRSSSSQTSPNLLNKLRRLSPRRTNP